MSEHTSRHAASREDEDRFLIKHDYVSRDELAKHLGVSTRTIARYDAQRAGPPSMLWGKRRIYHLGKARQWFEGLLVEGVGY